MNNIILASKSRVRKKILETGGIFCEVVPSNVDEDSVKEALSKENASPEIISKNLDDLKKLIINHPKKHIILDLLSVEEFQVVDSLVSFQSEFLDQNLSFIIVIREGLLNLFDEDLPVVPSKQEGIDFFEMDQIQRELQEE